MIPPGGRRVVLDEAYPDDLLALEADRHHSSRIDWGRDRTRNRLAAIGWRILPVTWDDLAQPADMLDAVWRGLRRKPRHVGYMFQTSVRRWPDDERGDGRGGRG